MNGENLIGYRYPSQSGKTFKAINPATNTELEGDFFVAEKGYVAEALDLAEQAFATYRLLGKGKRAAFLRAIADEIEALGDTLIERAMAESGLPAGRLSGERGRTTGQLRLFADYIDEGSWVQAVIDTALPDRQPLPRPDIRRMLVPLGPVVVFGASNFPLAFSVAGGDTASALAAGCPVVVKAHSAHPGTSALVASAIKKAAEKTGMPEGVFSMLFDDGYTVGEALVKHPKTKAVTFTGSYNGGMALVKLGQERKEPIPVFAEMGSINPVLFLPRILAQKPEELAAQYAGSITLGAGQFCTNPGLLLAVRSEGLERFKNTLAGALQTAAPSTMLTPGICKNYDEKSAAFLTDERITVLTKSGVKTAAGNEAVPVLATIRATDFIADEKYQEEVFGPYSLLVEAESEAELVSLLKILPGQLTLTVMAAEKELREHPALADLVALKAGRVLMNGVPTGVEVSHAMQHGGPFPATNDGRFTSVGTSAILRFARPVAWQNWDEELLPDELKSSNPLGISRVVDGKRSTDALS
ncbi:MAG: aldehyde dehydrogenase (NADP(+)) [Mucilaginibacter polytrichastri]|nr:aldehyde dehydrogenase (NADP(+)) [Mucilaginibacter polytrichastri]